MDIHNRLLVIDTATEACSAALFERENCIGADYLAMGRGHAERIIPMISALPDNGRASSIAVNCGPGSFTGIRVGIAAAQGLAIAWQAIVSGYNSLAMVAHMARQNGANTGIAVAMKAGHGEVFVQQFDAKGMAKDKVVSMPPPIAAQYITMDHIVGTAAEDIVALRGYGSHQHVLPDARHFPIGTNFSTMAVRPVYGRAPDAKPQQHMKG